MATFRKNPEKASEREPKSGDSMVKGGAGLPPPSRAEQYAQGKFLRIACPRKAHGVWKAPSDRRDPVELVLEAEKGRLPDLLPLRHGT